tara:strand:+ start:10016 stop:10306 length:291 start_codon:yes stop_codon:yes gene_type:complete
MERRDLSEHLKEGDLFETNLEWFQYFEGLGLDSEPVPGRFIWHHETQWHCRMIVPHNKNNMFIYLGEPPQTRDIHVYSVALQKKVAISRRIKFNII